MSEEVSKIVDSPVIWLIALTTIGAVLLLAVIYLVKTIKISQSVGLTKVQVKTAIKTSAVASIGPSMVVMVGMISLLIVAGAPMAMARLSVIGNVSFELLCAGLAADAFGTTVSMENMTPEIFQTMVFVMAVGCIGYILVPVLCCNSFEKILDMLSNNGKNVKRATMISTVAILGIYAYVDAPYLLSMDSSTIAMITGFVMMLILMAIQKKTSKKWLLEWGMLIAMLFGMAAGAVI